MKNFQEFYILGEPVETEVGTIAPLKVIDYAEYAEDLYVVSLTKNFLIYQYMKMNKDGQMDEAIEQLKKLNLLEIVWGMEDLRKSYIKILDRSFGNRDYFDLLNESNFEFIRDIILKINCSKEEDAYLNLEIQEAVERSRRVKNQDNDNSDISDVISSVVVYTGIDYSTIKNWTLYQLFAAYSRINQFQSYDTSTLFATVAEKVNIEHWGKHIDLFEKEDHAMSMSDFNKQYGSMF